jgi:hypothetical protein
MHSSWSYVDSFWAMLNPAAVFAACRDRMFDARRTKCQHGHLLGNRRNPFEQSAYPVPE